MVSFAVRYDLQFVRDHFEIVIQRGTIEEIALGVGAVNTLGDVLFQIDNATWILPPDLVQIGAAALTTPGKLSRHPRINITIEG